VEIDEVYGIWAEDVQALAEVGRAIFPQPTRLLVRLPHRLAQRAVAAWEREAYEGPFVDEAAEQRAVRHRAGILALIGLSIEQGGVSAGEDVVVELEAWYVGAALDAADDAGLLERLPPPPR
jgi:hypothetical protein